jgi:hypothetical protein
LVQLVVRYHRLSIFGRIEKGCDYIS